VHEAGASVLFGRSRRLDVWNQRFDEGTVQAERWTRALPQPPAASQEEPLLRTEALLIIAVRRRGRLRPFDDETTLGAKEEVVIAMAEDRRAEAEALLAEHGWEAARRKAETPAT
jgi:hypothetical protein